MTSIAFGSSSAAGGISNSFSCFIGFILHARFLVLLTAICGLSLLRRRRVLHPFVEPCDHLPQGMLGGFAGEIAMRFVWKLHVTHDSAVALNGLVHALTLDGERSGIIVGHAVDQQDWVPDFVSVHEWRNLDVHFRGFPDGAALALESERRQRAIVSSTR